MYINQKQAALCVISMEEDDPAFKEYILSRILRPPTGCNDTNKVTVRLDQDLCVDTQGCTFYWTVPTGGFDAYDTIMISKYIRVSPAWLAAKLVALAIAKPTVHLIAQRLAQATDRLREG